MSNYYVQKLGSQKLFKVYETEISGVREYLNSEIDFVKKDLLSTQKVLELGCGYGRIVKELASFCDLMVGIDISKDSIMFGQEYIKGIENATLQVMDVHSMELCDSFDVILCLQNGLSSMKINDDDIKNILKHLNFGGKAYFSTYSDKFWDTRLKWFEEQEAKGLLGKIDYKATKNGVIVCEDGFKAYTYSEKDLSEIGKISGYPYTVVEVDESSLFLIINKE